MLLHNKYTVIHSTIKYNDYFIAFFDAYTLKHMHACTLYTFLLMLNVLLFWHSKWNFRHTLCFIITIQSWCILRKGQKVETCLKLSIASNCEGAMKLKNDL